MSEYYRANRATTHFAVRADTFTIFAYGGARLIRHADSFPCINP